MNSVNFKTAEIFFTTTVSLLTTYLKMTIAINFNNEA